MVLKKLLSLFIMHAFLKIYRVLSINRYLYVSICATKFDLDFFHSTFGLFFTVVPVFAYSGASPVFFSFSCQNVMNTLLTNIFFYPHFC